MMNRSVEVSTLSSLAIIISEGSVLDSAGAPFARHDFATAADDPSPFNPRQLNVARWTVVPEARSFFSAKG
jgi:hypothetical protein